MKTKIVGILVCMLLIATALPAVGTMNIKTTDNNTLPIPSFEMKTQIGNSKPCTYRAIQFFGITGW